MAAVEARESSDDGSTVGVTRFPVADLPGFVRQREPDARPLGVGRHHAVVSGAPGGRRPGRTLRRPAAPPRRPPAVPVRRAGSARRRRHRRLGCAPAGHRRRPRPLSARRPRRPPRPGCRARAAARQRSRPRPEQGRLGLLLAAESSGALVAAEMTHAGLPWRADVHERLLTELLGPRPVAGRRPAVLERLLTEIRAAFGDPRAEPRLTRRAAARPPDRRAAGERHPLLDPRAARAPRHPRAAGVQEAVAAAPGQRLELAGHLGARRAVPLVLPARRRGHRAVGLQRGRRAVGARPRSVRRRSPTTAGGSSSPTSPSWSRACSPA